MAIYDDEFIANCRKMIRLNQEKVDEQKVIISEETDPRERAFLIEELEGWEHWLNFWKNNLTNALEARSQAGE